MANEEPAFLTAGIEVSAKYRGAFCEAKVKKVDKNVKCKVTLKDDGKVLIVQDEDIRGSLRVGAAVEVRRADTGLYVEGTLNRINDLSTYTVVFDDGDENTLRRTKLCLKGDRHFMKSETLDDLPLTHPEHFGTPVVRKTPKSKNTNTASWSGSESDVESSDDDSETGSKRTYSIHSQQNLVGRVLCVDFEERSRRAASVIPVLVVLPSADDVLLPSRHHLLVKSFKDGKFLTTAIANTKEFSSEIISKNKDKGLKAAYDKAQSYKERRELPPNWNRMELLGYSSSESGESSDDEPDEKKDRFVAELFKFMDDRGTPINKAPSLGGYDLNLFKLFRIVQSLNGYNKVTNQMKWHVVHSKLNLPSSASVVSTDIKQAYKKFLHAFEDFNRKLGCTMVMSSQSRMSSRSLVSFRERDQASKHSRNKRVGSVKDEEIDSKVTVLKKDVEAEKMDKQMDKQMSVLVPAKTGPEVPLASSSSSSSTLLVKARTAKKSGAKKDSGDSDSVSSDIMVTPRASSSIPSAYPSGKLSTEVAKSSGAAPRPAKDCEKPSQTSLKTPKDEPARVTRGDSLKTRENVVKEDRASVRKTDGKDNSRTKIETEKTDGEKEEKQRGSRRILRRLAAIASAEEEGEDEAKSLNSEKTHSDEPSETNDSFTNDDPKADDEIPRTVTGRRHTNCEDMYPIGTRMQVRYGKGKGQKIYEAKVLDTSVQSGVVKYFVHYNGWNSRYDEWIHKDVIVNILEEPALEMPKLRSSAIPPTKSLSSSLKKKVNLPSGSPLPPNKDEARFGRSKATALGPEETPLGSRRTRSNSVDQIKSSSGRNRIANLKASEAGHGSSNNGTSSSNSSSLSSSSEAEERETASESIMADSKTEHNTDEDLSNSYHSCSPVETPEMPDIYLSEEDECGRDGVPKLQDHDASDTLDDAMCHLPEMELNVSTEELNKVSLELQERVVEKESSKPLRTEVSVSLSDSFCAKKEKMPVIELQCDVAETALPSEDLSTKPCSEFAPNDSVSEPKDELQVSLNTETAGDSSKMEVAVCLTASDLPDKEGVTPSAAEGESSVVVDLPSLTDATASVTKTRRKKKMLEKSEVLCDDSGQETKSDLKPADVKNVSDFSAVDTDKKTCFRKRKLSGCLEYHEEPVTELSVKNSSSDAESKTASDAGIESDDSKFQSTKLLSKKFGSIAKESTISKEKVLKKATKISRTDCNLEDRSSEVSNSTENEPQWKCDAESESKLVKDCKDFSADQFNSSAHSLKLELLQTEKDFETSHETVDECLQPSSVCLPPSDAEDNRARNEDANLLSEFAVKCSEEMEMKNVFNDSPPASAENSPSAPDVVSSPSQEELTSTKSEQEANLEVEKYMERRLDSSICYDFSTASSDSTASSSCSIQGFENVLLPASIRGKKKFEEETSEMHPRKRRRHKEDSLEGNLSSKSHYHNELNDSDHDNSLTKLSRSTASSLSPAKSSSHCLPTTSCHRQQQFHHHLHRPSKYNFIDLEEGKYLEGEDRIIFLTNKIQDLRSAYMELKAEVASIDRRRRRHRVKEKEMAQMSAVGSSSSTVAST